MYMYSTRTCGSSRHVAIVVGPLYTIVGPPTFTEP